MPLKCPKSVKRSRMIRETAHNATAVRGEKPALKDMRVLNIAAFAPHDQRLDAISARICHQIEMSGHLSVTRLTSPSIHMGASRRKRSLTVITNNSRDADIF